MPDEVEVGIAEGHPEGARPLDGLDAHLVPQQAFVSFSESAAHVIPFSLKGIPIIRPGRDFRGIRPV